jgi:chromate transport protein ChrA
MTAVPGALALCPRRATAMRDHQSVVPHLAADPRWPGGQIAVMRHTRVDEKRWLETTPVPARADYCMLLAGPEAQQLPLRLNRSLPAGVTGITAAVVGVIANLAAYFAVHMLFSATRTVDAGPIQGRFPT